MNEEKSIKILKNYCENKQETMKETLVEAIKCLLNNYEFLKEDYELLKQENAQLCSLPYFNHNSKIKIDTSVLDEFASIFSQTLRILQEEIKENKENLHNFETVDNLITKWNDLVDFYEEGECDE